MGDYRVEGEVGRFTFALFDVIDTEERPVFEGRCLLPPRQGRQWYQTWGFKELALLHGAAQRSYRQTVEGLNRWRRQPEGGTPLNTLRYSAEAEGVGVLSFLERKGQQVFERYGFSAEGDPAAGCPAVAQAKDYQPQVLERGRVASALEAVCQDMRQRGLAEALVAEVERQAPAAVYESAADTVNIHIDEVGGQVQDLNLHPADFHGEDWNYSQDFRFDPISRVDNAVKARLIVGKSCRKRKS